MSRAALLEAVNLAGGQAALASGIRALMPESRVAQGHISKWLLRQLAEVPPGEYVVAIAQHLDWRITPHQLRPDLYPNPTDALPPDVSARQEQEAAA